MAKNKKMEALQKKLDAIKVLMAKEGTTQFKVLKDYLTRLNSKTPPKAKALSTKAKAVLDTIVEQDFGCNRNKVINLMSVVLGERLPVPSSNHCLPIGSIVKVLKDADSHNYELDKFAIVVDQRSNHMMSEDGVVGNHLPWERKEVWRQATPAEAKAFINRLGFEAMRIVNFGVNDPDGNVCDIDDSMELEKLEGNQLDAEEAGLLEKTPKK